MNKKGFTLIELLAVTVILGLMILVVMPNLLSTLADVKEREKTVLRERLQEAALVYAENNKNNIPELKKVNGTVYITLGDLVDSKLLDPPVIDPTTGDEIPLTTYIKITKTASNKFAVTFDVLLPSPPPVITILGDNPITIDKGSTYTDAGATATSSKDGNLTSSIVKTGTVNTTIGGTYYITYSVTDSNGTTVSESRTVIVFVPPAPVNFAYTGAVQTYAIKIPGTYKLEVWGAQGGGDITYPGGKGGYATGNIYLTEGQTINVYVGQQGQNSVEAGNGAGGWNGGGTGASSHGGGGATDIRVNGTALTNRVIVAGSGGGGYITTSAGGYGGGLVGQNSPYQSNTTYGIIAGGTQTSGGTYGGTLGIGGNASSYTSSGGGGGYYGGGSNNSQAVNTAGAGGSSYIGGVQNGQTIAGNASMPSPTGGTETGHTGNGYSKLSFVSRSQSGTQPAQVTGFAYTGDLQNFTVPLTGTYKLEVWGAQGGGDGTTNGQGGKGGYTVGLISLTSGQVLNIYVGGQGTSKTVTTGSYFTLSGGYNGGGATTTQGYVGSGGGATDIRVGGTELTNRAIVAGGGGGGGYSSSNSYNCVGGAGGGTSGINGSPGSWYFGYGGTSSAGGSYSGTYTCSGTANTAGVLGIGGNGTGCSNGGGGGGGGYYGGGGAGIGGGGGGSSYTGTLSSALTIAGNASMPSTSGSTETGHAGNGYANIYFISP